MNRKEFIKIIGNKITLLKQENGFITEKLSKRINIARSTLWMIETGKADPKISTLIKIANYFEVNISEFLNVNK
jgi:DNA-binding XRE family transcriptional regulator